MKLVAKISGPIETDSDFYLAKGKLEGQDWEGVIQKKGDVGVLMALKHKKAKNQVGNQKIVSYSGGVTAKIEAFKKGAEVTFENVGTLNRRPEKKSAEDLHADTAELLAENKRLAKVNEEQAELTGDIIKEMKAMKAELATLKAGGSETPEVNAEEPNPQTPKGN